MNCLPEWILVAEFLLCAFAMVFALVSVRIGGRAGLKVFVFARAAVQVAAILSAVVLVLLISAFLRNDFSIALVSRYSSIELPIFYKISAVWASSAGSLLLWQVLMLVFFALFLSRLRAGQASFGRIALSIGSCMSLVFLALVIFVARPFVRSVATIDNGMGLNPLLQDFWMIVHPPLLFAGYSVLLVPFVMVSAGAFTRYFSDNALLEDMRRWLLLSFCFLALGIATGAKWAYTELGWGGFWGWDPVENASLLPWLIVTAALHSLAVTRKTHRFRLFSSALVGAGFVLCLAATFITRSGILHSVHAFDTSVIGPVLLVFIAATALVVVVSVVAVWKSCPPAVTGQNQSIFNKSNLLLLTNLILIFLAVMVAVGTFWPVISQIAVQKTIAVGREFYDRLAGVAGIALAFLIGLCTLARFKAGVKYRRVLLGSFIGGAVAVIVYSFIKSPPLPVCLGIAACLFGVLVVIITLRGNLAIPARLGATIVHLGILLLIFSIAGLSAGQHSAQALLTKGEKLELGGYELRYDSFRHKQYSSILKAGPEMILKKGKKQEILWPHNTIYPSEQITSEVAVSSSVKEDVYLVFNGIGPDEKVFVEVTIKPLMNWLWAAMVLIAIGPVMILCRIRISRGRK